MRVILIVTALLCVVECNAKSAVTMSNSVSLKSSKSDFSLAVNAAAPAKAKASSGKSVAAVSSDGLKDSLKLVGLFTLWYLIRIYCPTLFIMYNDNCLY